MNMGINYLPAKKQDTSVNLGLIGEHFGAEASTMPVMTIMQRGVR